MNRTQPTRQPSLQTERLVLRPFALADAEDVQRLVGDRDVAEPTSGVPHPYLDGMAESWIKSHRKFYADGRQIVFAITLRESDELIGSISLMEISQGHQRAEIGYWLGKDYWGKGYVTEAARKVIAFGFELSLHRIHARCLKRNQASARVLEKAGMQFEGCLRGHELKAGRFEDVLLYGVVKEDWTSGR